MYNFNGIVDYVMITDQLHLDWPSHWPSGDSTIIVLDDSEWPQVHDPEWEAAEAKYENGDVIDSVSEGEDEILRVSDSDGFEGQVNNDGESIKSGTPSTEIEDEETSDAASQPIAKDQKQTYRTIPHSLTFSDFYLTCLIMLYLLLRVA